MGKGYFPDLNMFCFLPSPSLQSSEERDDENFQKSIVPAKSYLP